MSIYKEQFSPEWDSDFEGAPGHTIVLASTGRSGSHMLGHLMHSTGLLGCPLEYLNPTNIPEWHKRFQTQNLTGMVEELKRRRTSPNGVFSIKVHYSHLNKLGGIETLRGLFPNAKFLLVHRKDLLGQAISMDIARQTGCWIAGMQSREVEPVYSFGGIELALREIIRDTSSWRYLFACIGEPYLEVDYEQVLKNSSDALMEAANFCDVSLLAEQLPSKLVTDKQGGERNSEWRDRFLADFTMSEGQYELFNRRNSGIGFLLRSYLKRLLKNS